MHGILWYMSLIRISDSITYQAISVTLLGGETERHPGHATPGGDGITAPDVRTAWLKLT
jgi:hypothetical protein